MNQVVWRDDSEVQTLEVSKVFGDVPHVLVMMFWREKEETQ